MKILFNYGGAYVYGKEISGLNYMVLLKNLGHKIKNICNGWNNGKFIQLLTEEGIDYYAVKIGKISKSLKLEHLKWTIDALIHLPFALFKLKKTIKNFDPDIIVFDSSYSFYFTNQIAELKHVILVHHENPNRNFFFNYMLNNKNVKIKHIAVSDFIKIQLEKLYIPEQNITVIYDSFLLHNNLNFDAKNEIFTIGYIGQIGKWKGIDTFIDLLKSLNQEGYRTNAVIAGNGESDLLEELKQNLREAQIEEHVVWLGYQDDVSNFYNSIDVLIFPTKFAEPFGRVAAESLAYGKPVIASNIGGIPEIINHGINGYLFNPGDVKQAKKHVINLMNNNEIRQTIIQNGKQTILNKFNTQNQQKAIQSLVLSFAN